MLLEHDTKEPLTSGGKTPIPAWQNRALAIGGTIAVVMLPAVLMVEVPRHTADKRLPFYLSLGAMLLLGWIAGRAADFLFGLPPLLGYMAFGFAFRQVEADAMVAARPYVLALSFVLVLVRAGLEVRPQDVNAVSLALGLLPYAADLAATAACAASIFGLRSTVAVTFGAVMSALGDGIVIPRMADLCARAESAELAALPRAVLTAAPIECTVALFTYGTLAELLTAQKRAADALAHAAATGATMGTADLHQPPVAMQAVLVMLRLIGTLLVAAMLAHVFALLLGARRRIMWASGKRLFACTPTEELVVVLAGAMLAYGAAALVPMPGATEPARVQAGASRVASSGRLVEADLAVVATAFFFARLRPAHTVARVEASVGSVWSVAALCLFVSLGSALELPELAPDLGFAGSALALVAPLGAGLCARFLCYLCLLRATARARRTPPTMRNAALEASFCSAATLPRATVQGVLGALPLHAAIVSDAEGQLIRAAAAGTVLLLAPLGVVVQEAWCERALEVATPPSPPPPGAREHLDELDAGEASGSSGAFSGLVSALRLALAPHWLADREVSAEHMASADGELDVSEAEAVAVAAAAAAMSAASATDGAASATRRSGTLSWAWDRLDLERIALLHTDGPQLPSAGAALTRLRLTPRGRGDGRGFGASAEAGSGGAGVPARRMSADAAGLLLAAFRATAAEAMADELEAAGAGELDGAAFRRRRTPGRAQAQADSAPSTMAMQRRSVSMGQMEVPESTARQNWWRLRG